MTEEETTKPSNDPESDLYTKPDKNTEPSPPQQVTDGGEILPVLDDDLEDDGAEPEDADVGHQASEEDVEENT